MNIKATALALTLAMTFAGTVFASEIYKWVDEDGSVHYGDRPTGAASEEHLSISSRPTNPAVVQARVVTRLSAQTAKAEAEANAPKGPSEEELRAEARDRAEKCSTYRQRLEKFVQSRRLYREDESGERIYLDEEQTQAARERVQNQVEEYCSS